MRHAQAPGVVPRRPTTRNGAGAEGYSSYTHRSARRAGNSLAYVQGAELVVGGSSVRGAQGNISGGGEGRKRKKWQNCRALRTGRTPAGERGGNRACLRIPDRVGQLVSHCVDSVSARRGCAVREISPSVAGPAGRNLRTPGMGRARMHGALDSYRRVASWLAGWPGLDAAGRCGSATVAADVEGFQNAGLGCEWLPVAAGRLAFVSQSHVGGHRLNAICDNLRAARCCCIEPAPRGATASAARNGRGSSRSPPRAGAAPARCRPEEPEDRTGERTAGDVPANAAGCVWRSGLLLAGCGCACPAPWRRAIRNPHAWTSARIAIRGSRLSFRTFAIPERPAPLPGSPPRSGAGWGNNTAHGGQHGRTNEGGARPTNWSTGACSSRATAAWNWAAGCCSRVTDAAIRL